MVAQCDSVDLGRPALATHFFELSIKIEDRRPSCCGEKWDL